MRSPVPLPAAAAVVAALLALSACGGGSREGASAEDTLRIAGPFEVHSLEPAADGEIFTRLQVSETLVTSDIEGELSPGLATEWSYSPDGTEWSFELVEDATFRDGSPLTPDAVVEAVEKA